MSDDRDTRADDRQQRDLGRSLETLRERAHTVIADGLAQIERNRLVLERRSTSVDPDADQDGPLNRRRGSGEG